MMEKRTGGKVTVVLVCVILVTAALVIFQAAKGFSVRGSGQAVSGGGPPGAGGAGNSGGVGNAGAPAGNSGGAGNAGAPAGRTGGAGNAGAANNAGGTGRTAANNAGGGSARQGERTAAAVRTARVELGSVENQVVLGGVVLAASEVPVYPVVGGKLSGLRVKIGDRVRQGDVIATVDPSKPGDSFFASPVTSAVSGTVLSLPVPVGDTVQSSTAVCIVGDISRLRIETYVPERFSANMRIGLPAQVRFEAVPGEYFSAEVDEMSPVLDPASRTRRIMLSFTGASGAVSGGVSGSADPRIMAGMFASLGLVTNSRSGVPVIPRQSLINTYGSWIVFVVEDSGDGKIARRREIERGLESEEMVEIAGGLEVGEMVVTEGQTFLSDGDPLRPVGE